MKKNSLKVIMLFLISVVSVLMSTPAPASAEDYVKLSENYVEGKYKYYFASPSWENNELYFCRSNINGSNEKILCKGKKEDIGYAEFLEINGHYGDKFFYSMGYPSGGSYFGVVDIKNKKMKTTKYPGISEKITQSQYLLNSEGYTGDWCILPTYVFDAKKNKFKLLAQYCDRSAVFGDNVIYVKSSYQASYKVHSATVYKYNLKSGKVTKLKKLEKLYAVGLLGTNFLANTEMRSGDIKLIDFGKATTKLGDGTYSVNHLGNQKYSGENGIYKAKFSNNKLIMYGNFKKKGKKTLNDSKYEIKLDSNCKLYNNENDGGKDVKVKYDLKEFNPVFNNMEKGLRFEFQIKNGKVCEINIFS